MTCDRLVDVWLIVTQALLACRCVANHYLRDLGLYKELRQDPGICSSRCMALGKCGGYVGLHMRRCMAWGCV
jgi:hypothetical protein